MDQSIIRITKELSDIQKNPDLSLAVAYRDIDVRSVKALIMGPHETPYEFGFFEFTIKFDNGYPSKAPSVQCITTNEGRARFNPNIYSDGKVCLSILGTWRGEPGEQWSSAQGLESILLSIQSLMAANPYANEPGYENIGGAKSRQEEKSYIQKIQHETLRISVIQRLEMYLDAKPATVQLNATATEDFDLDLAECDAPFEPFKDLCKRRFLWYYDSYLATIQNAMQEVKDNQVFANMPFESKGNGLNGKFNYPELERRLRKIKSLLDEEPCNWAKEGVEEKKRESTVTVNLQYQFDQISHSLKHGNTSYDVTLEDQNPFVWIISYFGQPMTNLDGGLIRIRMTFSPRFPSEQPRVKVESKIFHHYIATDGTACYTPKSMKMEDVRSHIDAIITMLEDDDPAYDPRKIVNPEATRLYWSQKADDKKLYNRRLRRSVQDSMEDFPQ